MENFYRKAMILSYTIEFDGDHVFMDSAKFTGNYDIHDVEWVFFNNVSLYVKFGQDKNAHQFVIKKDGDYFKKLYEYLLPYTEKINIDSEKKKITIYHKDNSDIKVSYLDFQQIIKAELIKETETKYIDISTAQQWDKNKVKEVKTLLKLQIKLTINNINIPHIYINYISNNYPPIENVVQTIEKQCQKDLSALEVITHQNTTQEKRNYQPIPVEELKKLKDLLDLNIITQEEFDKKKKQLLDLIE